MTEPRSFADLAQHADIVREDLAGLDNAIAHHQVPNVSHLAKLIGITERLAAQVSELAERLASPIKSVAALANDPNAYALDRIAYMLRDPDWGVGMLEDIAELVVATGRDVEGDGEPTWDRH